MLRLPSVARSISPSLRFSRNDIVGCAEIKIAPEFLPARSPLRFVTSTSAARSGFSFLRVRGLLALGFQLSELLSGKNSFRLFQEDFPAFFCAACLHTFGLPRLDFCLLIGREIQRRQISAGRFAGVRHTLGATCLVSCECAGCNEHPGRN
jgi:hypothetical protein